MQKLFALITSTLYLAATRFAFAQIHGGGESEFELPNPLRARSLTELLDRVIYYLTLIAAPIVVIMVIVGAFQILTAGGSPDKVSIGKKTILYAVIGFAIVLLARGLIAILHQLLGVSSPSSPESFIPTESAL